MLSTPNRRIAFLLLAFVFILSAFATQYLTLERKFSRSRDTDFRRAETTYMPPNEMTRVFSLGYEPFVADLVLMAANAYFANHLSFDRKYRWLDNYLDSIIGYCRDRLGHRVFLPPSECEEQDGHRWVDGVFPFNPRVYLWASQVVKFAPLLTNEVIDKSIYYGKTGIHFCPDNWELYFDVGFNLYFEYRDKSQEERRILHLEGLSYMAVASVLPGSSVDPNFVAGNLWSKEETERAMQQVYMTYYHGTDAQRKEMRTRVRAYGERELADLFEAEEKNWQEQYPYIPRSLFHIISTRYEPAPPGKAQEAL